MQREVKVPQQRPQNAIAAAEEEELRVCAAYQPLSTVREMSFQRYNGSSSGGVSASRSVALDLMLRTFMNSSEFHSSRPRVWEKVSRLVPGTTPQQVRHYIEPARTPWQRRSHAPLHGVSYNSLQCYERWEELRTFTGNTVNRDCSGKQRLHLRFS